MLFFTHNATGLSVPLVDRCLFCDRSDSNLRCRKISSTVSYSIKSFFSMCCFSM